MATVVDRVTSDFTCSDCLSHFVHYNGVGGVGYGLVKEDGEEKRICYSCCASRDLAAMREAVAELRCGGRPLPVVLYLTEDSGGQRRVTNSPSSLIFSRVNVRRGRHNVTGRRLDIHFTDKDRNEWHGVLCGDWQAFRARPLKAQLYFPPMIRGEWFNATVRELMFDDTQSPILADALEETGCDVPEILSALRGGDSFAWRKAFALHQLRCGYWANHGRKAGDVVRARIVRGRDPEEYACLLFPDQTAGPCGSVMCYDPRNGHCAASINWIKRHSAPVPLCSPEAIELIEQYRRADKDGVRYLPIM